MRTSLPDGSTRPYKHISRQYGCSKEGCDLSIHRCALRLETAQPVCFTMNACAPQSTRAATANLPNRRFLMQVISGQFAAVGAEAVDLLGSGGLGRPKPTPPTLIGMARLRELAAPLRPYAQTYAFFVAAFTMLVLSAAATALFAAGSAGAAASLLLQLFVLLFSTASLVPIFAVIVIDFRRNRNQACEVSSEPKTATLDGVLALRLRAAIHLNIALCSLKREDWYLARKASEYAIEYDGFVSEHAMESLDDLSAASDSVASLRPKALYRLAQAYEGEGNTSCAIHALEQVLALEPKNREARTLMGALAQAEREEKSLWKGMIRKGGMGAVDAGTAQPAPMPEQEDFLDARIRSMMEAEAREEYEQLQALASQSEAPSVPEEEAQAEAIAKNSRAERVKRVRDMQKAAEREG